jgi:hypothetical protein
MITICDFGPDNCRDRNSDFGFGLAELCFNSARSVVF